MLPPRITPEDAIVLVVSILLIFVVVCSAVYFVMGLGGDKK